MGRQDNYLAANFDVELRENRFDCQKHLLWKWTRNLSKILTSVKRCSNGIIFLIPVVYFNDSFSLNVKKPSVKIITKGEANKHGSNWKCFTTSNFQRLKCSDYFNINMCQKRHWSVLIWRNRLDHFEFQSYATGLSTKAVLCFGWKWYMLA